MHDARVEDPTAEAGDAGSRPPGADAGSGTRPKPGTDAAADGAGASSPDAGANDGPPRAPGPDAPPAPPSTPAGREDAFRKRADALLGHLADRFKPPNYKTNYEEVTLFSGGLTDPQKTYWPKVIARLARDHADAEGNFFVAQLAREQAKGHPPFHFAFPGIVRILALFPDAPEVVAHRAEHLLQIWQRQDYYNAFTGEGTENQIAMCRTSAYLVAEALVAAPLPEVPVAMASDRLREMRGWVLAEAKAIVALGFGEWDSNTYAAYTAQGWLNLYDFARDQAVRDAARAVLDVMAVGLALKSSQGFVGGGSMRGAPVTSLDGSASYLAWLWFGDPPPDRPTGLEAGFFSGSEHAPSVHAATSRYRPPAAALRLARKNPAAPLTFRASRPAMLHERKLVKEIFHVGPGYTLGATFSPYGGWTGGSTQTANWRLVARARSGATALVVTGNGGGRHGAGGSDAAGQGEGRNPWDQLVQDRNVLIQMTRVPADAAALDTAIAKLVETWRVRWQTDLEKRFPAGSDHNLVTRAEIRHENVYGYFTYPGAATVRNEGGRLLLDLDGTYVAATPLGEKPFVLGDAGKGRRLARADGSVGVPCGFVLEVVSAAEQGSFAAFAAAIARGPGLDRSSSAAGRFVYSALDGRRIEARFGADGSFTEPIYNWGYGPDRPQVRATSPPFLQPTWPSGAGHGRLASWSVDGRAVDLTQDWPTIEGPGLLVDGGRIHLDADAEGGAPAYDVDFTADVPRVPAGP